MSVTTKESPGRGPGRSGDDGRSERRRPLTRVFDRFATAATRAAGSPYAFGGAVVAIVVWLVSGPLFHYSDAWQLVVNTGTTIITFLMVFLLQQSQNKDSVAMHLKLDELLSSQHAASNALIGIENASEEELRRLAATWLELASRRQKESDTHDGASDEPADEDDAAGKRNGPGA
ncbi:low affinity Fe/Cu permease [Paraburkholderia caballeronis]|uniref:low affinity iron permease family protein n=1 Tax=Paraburkholderia caballeronis TaxID=416943 RepID=UPI0010649A75|nr:low affinity iron permease family protein [Paraburkholderia caballeronis]TDV26669.1 low affinity Fe/Cu permease [Paraburkholderia caballeronis]